MLSIIGFLLTTALGVLVNIWIFKKIDTQDRLRLDEKQSIKWYAVLLGLSIFFYFIVLLWWGFDIKLLGFHGFRLLFIVGLAITMAFYGIINKEVISEFQKRLVFWVSIIPYFYFSLALVPFLGYFVVLSPMTRILGTQREVKFENEHYRLEQIESVVKADYEYYIIAKHDYYEKVIMNDNARKKEYDKVKDIRLEKGRIHIEK